jgi:DNA-binding CsgD family transcriptional regulator
VSRPPAGSTRELPDINIEVLIARALAITERTVKVHLGNGFRRIGGVGGRTSAALWSQSHLDL